MPADIIDTFKAKKIFDTLVNVNYKYNLFALKETRKQWIVTEAREALKQANILTSNIKKEISGTELIKQLVCLVLW